MANNNRIFNAALSGSMSGISSRWVTESISAPLANIRLAVNAFATSFDAAIAAIAGGASEAEARLVETICADFWRDRIQVDLLSTDYDSIVVPLVLIFTTMQGDLLPEPGGSSGGSDENVARFNSLGEIVGCPEVQSDGTFLAVGDRDGGLTPVSGLIRLERNNGGIQFRNSLGFDFVSIEFDTVNLYGDLSVDSTYRADVTHSFLSSSGGGATLLTISPGLIDAQANDIVTTGEYEAGATPVAADGSGLFRIGHNKTVISGRDFSNAANVPILRWGSPTQDLIFIGSSGIATLGIRFDISGGNNYDFRINNSQIMILDDEGLIGMPTVGFVEQDNGNTGASQTVTWTNGQKQRSELNAATVAVTHTFSRAGNYIWRVVQDATTQCTALTLTVTGGSALFPAGSLRIGSAANAETIVNIYYDGTNAYFSSAANMETGSVVFV